VIFALSSASGIELHPHPFRDPLPSRADPKGQNHDCATRRPDGEAAIGRRYRLVREVASRTEVYWCPTKHARRVLGPHPHYQDFADFGDAEAYSEKLAQMKDGVKIEGAA
jgi:hypothetical protein